MRRSIKITPDLQYWTQILTESAVLFQVIIQKEL